MRSLSVISIFFLISSSEVIWGGTVLYEKTNYHGKSDSPWYAAIQAGDIYLDVLENANVGLNLPGVTVNASISRLNRFGVDEDDGILDGYGRSNSLTTTLDEIWFTFRANSAGEYPHYFGAVWLEGFSRSGYIQVEAIGEGISLYNVIGPAFLGYDTANYLSYGKFFGFYNPAGFKEIRFSGERLDHVHVGWIPEPSGVVLSFGALGLLVLCPSRRRTSVKEDCDFPKNKGWSL